MEMTQKMTTEESCMLRTLHQIQNIKICTIIKDKRKYPGFSKYSQATLYRHAKMPLDGSRQLDFRHRNKGRPKLYTQRALHNIKRQITVLRDTIGTFTSKQLQEEAGVMHISNSTFRRVLRQMGYGYRRTRKKGLLTKLDLYKRLKFARKVKRMFNYHERGSYILWTRGISMYVDGVGFEYKSNPFLHAKRPQAREWRLKNEGLLCTSKGKKEGAVQAKFLVGIGHNAGVVLCERLTQKMNGRYYASLVHRCFRSAFKKTMSPKAKRVLVDGDPSQNSKRAKKAIARINAKLFKIPPRSPDLNPIENVFHLVRRRLDKEAQNKRITSETKDQFADRVKQNLADFDISTIDKIIESMPKRIDRIIKKRGLRLKY